MICNRKFEGWLNDCMKILFYINNLYGGGAERVISILASYFAENDWDTILLTSYRGEGEYLYSKKVCRMSIEDRQIIQSFARRNLSRIKALRCICKEEKVDVVVSFMREPNCRALLATMGLHVKTIISVRSDPDQEYGGRIGEIIKKYLLSFSDGAVFQTQNAKLKFPLKMQSRSAVIYNMVDDAFFDKKYVQGEDIITCGRLCSLKNHALLIRAFEKVYSQFPNERLCIYGLGEEQARLTVLINKLNLDEAVILKGQCDDVSSVLSSAKLFVLSSDCEGMPNALMEAMVVGVPSISTDCPCGGPRELFGDELEEMLVPVGDVDALAEKMVQLLSDDAKRLEIGRKLRKRAEDFRTSVIGEKWIGYVKAVCRK